MDLLFVLLYAIVFTMVSYGVHIILHELGHLCFAWLTGWKFIHLQVGRINLGRKRGHIKLFITKNKSSRCIMYPKDLTQGAILYTAGGFILNGFIAIGSVMLLLRVDNKTYLWVSLWCLFVVGLAVVITNAIPIVSRVISDGECINILLHDEKSKMCHNAQLLIAQQLAEGKSYHQMDESLFFILDDDAEDDIQAYHKVLEYYYHLDRNELTLAHIAIYGIEHGSRISKGVKNIIEAERLYLKMSQGQGDLSDENKNMIESMAKDYKQMDVHIHRTIAIYNSIRLLDASDTQTILEGIDYHLEEMQKNEYQYDGEKKFCLKQLYNMKHSLN